ncbi:MAG: hypothetical protein ACW972_08265 [Promethearchaeota archaeon]|jgi:hypothetical protein
MENKINDIISGWSNFIDKSEVTEEIAKQRAEICSKCEHAKKSMLLGFVKDELKEVEGYYCSDCFGCPLSAKIRTKNDICEKWKKDTHY